MGHRRRSLLVTEAGGLIGNFTGEADFLYRREVIAGSPRIYGQLVQLLGPYSASTPADSARARAAPPIRAPRFEGR